MNKFKTKTAALAAKLRGYVFSSDARFENVFFVVLGIAYVAFSLLGAYVSFWMFRDSTVSQIVAAVFFSPYVFLLLKKMNPSVQNNF